MAILNVICLMLTNETYESTQCCVDYGCQPAYLASIGLTTVHMAIAYPENTIIIDGAIPIALSYVMKHDLDTEPALQVF